MLLTKMLKALEAEDERLRLTRYFDCVGNPYECKVLLVGINPSLGLLEGKSFWDYWNDATGFDHEDWFKDYKEEVDGKFVESLKPTRRRIEKLREKLAGPDMKMLNCNICSIATKRQSELRNIDKSTNVFQVILHEIKPEVIILSGKPPKKVLSILGRNYDKDSRDWTIHDVTFAEFGSKVISVPHLFYMAMDGKKGNDNNVEELASLLLRRSQYGDVRSG